MPAQCGAAFGQIEGILVLSAAVLYQKDTDKQDGKSETVSLSHRIPLLWQKEYSREFSDCTFRSPGKRANDSFRFVVDYGQEDAGGPIRNTTTLFPILQCPHVETESLCEFSAA